MEQHLLNLSYDGLNFSEYVTEIGSLLKQNWNKWEHLKFFGYVVYSGACILIMELQPSPIYSHSCFPRILGGRGLL